MSRIAHVGHLARRFWGSLSRAEPEAADVRWAADQLLVGEGALWQQMSVQDRRHSLLVARRFVALRPAASREEIAAALLHDVGKQASLLGTLSRVLATIVGPRTDRFRTYHDHEALGVEMAIDAGSAAATIELLNGDGPAAAALIEADHI